MSNGSGRNSIVEKKFKSIINLHSSKYKLFLVNYRRGSIVIIWPPSD